MYAIYEKSEHIVIIKRGNLNYGHLTANLSDRIGSKKILGQRHSEPCDIRNSENWVQQFRFEENISRGIKE